MLSFFIQKKRSTPTGTCLILITPDSERTMVTFLGTAGKINENDIHIEAIKEVIFYFLKVIYGMKVSLKKLLIKR